MKTVLITGVGRGIGRALAEKFLAEGWRVLGTVFSSPDDFQHSHLILYPLNLAKPESIAAGAAALKTAGEKINLLINNAGICPDEEETRVKVDKLHATLAVNLIGLIDFTEQIIPLINSGGQIINISSTAGSLALAGEGKSHYPDHYPSYRISKAALNMYTVTLARQLKSQNIAVSAVHPGWVKTAMGGEEADLTPATAASDIFNFATTPHETGRFWFQNQPLPW